MDPGAPDDPPLRPIRTMVDAALSELDADFNAIYSESMAVTPSRRIASCVPNCWLRVPHPSQRTPVDGTGRIGPNWPISGQRL